MKIQFSGSNHKIVACIVYGPARDLKSDFFVNFESLSIESQKCNGKKMLFG